MKTSLLLNIHNKIRQDPLLKKVAKNSGIIFSGNSIWSALNLISFGIMAKQIGPDSLAVLVLAQTYAMIINDIFNIQTWESMLKFGSEKSESVNIINVIKSNLLLDIISATAAFMLALALIQPAAYLMGWEKSFLNIITIYTFSIFFNITTLTIGIPRLFDKFLPLAKLQVSVGLLKLASVLFALFFANSLMVYIYIYLLTDILMNLVVIIYSLGLVKVRYGRGWWKERIYFDKKQLSFIWWTNLRTIVRIPVRRLDIMIINLLMSTKMVGIFKVYKEIAGIMSRLSDPINQAIFPEFAKLIGENKISQSKDMAKKMISLLFFVSLICTVVMLILAKPLVHIFFGSEYMSHIPVLLVLILSHWLAFFTTPIHSLFIAAGFAKYSFYLVLFSNTLFLLMAFSFGKLMGIYGIIVAYMIQGIISQGLKVFLMKKHSDGWNDIIR